MNLNEKHFIILSPSPQEFKNHSHSQLLAIPLELPHKSQISSIPGISPKQRDRYRTVLGDEVLGDRLTLDKAIALVKGGAK